jgi:hypothetical protein
MSPISRTKARRIRDRKRVEAILKSLSEGSMDTYEGYRELYGLWCSNNAAVQELRPLFSIPGIEPDGRLSITDDFRAEIRSLSAKILPLFSDSKTEAS